MMRVNSSGVTSLHTLKALKKASLMTSSSRSGVYPRILRGLRGRVRHQNILSEPSEDYRTFGTWRGAALNHQVKKTKEQTKQTKACYRSVDPSPKKNNSNL